MAKYVALLRGVGGPRQTPASELRQVGEQLGYSDVSTYIATGNLLFRSDRTAAALRKELYPVLSARFGFDIPVLVVSDRTLARAVAGNPFSDRDSSLVSVTFLARALANDVRDELRAALADGERLELGPPNAKWLYADLSHGHQNSKLARKLLAPMRSGVATTRNIRTTTALRARLKTLGERPKAR
jgi:uncharacterized protein (DUF1697 family)